MSKELKAYRGFNEDGTYFIGNEKWKIKNDINGKTLVDWNNRMNDIVNSIRSRPLVETNDKSITLSKEILEKSLEGFNYDKALETCHPKELEAAAGNLHAFLFQIGTKREFRTLKSISRFIRTYTNNGSFQSWIGHNFRTGRICKEKRFREIKGLYSYYILHE
jgi:hypothetical protein